MKHTVSDTLNITESLTKSCVGAVSRNLRQSAETLAHRMDPIYMEGRLDEVPEGEEEVDLWHLSDVFDFGDGAPRSLVDLDSVLAMEEELPEVF